MILPTERIDLAGASGAVYSFYLVDPAALAGRAGAYAIVRGDGTLAQVGETESLPTAAALLAKARALDPAARLFIRLIVRRQSRVEELQDLLEGCPLPVATTAASSTAA